ncbi:MAG: CPBP family intramembrane metalloprotease [Chloroflexi bacterium]|nr:CPBP family intramembrane metalloprotease [Chloroflexota bacterium]
MHWVRWFFWNRTEKRLRAGWRIAIHFVLWVYTPALLKYAVGDWVASGLPGAFQSADRIRDLLVEFALRLPAILISTWLMVYWVDHRPLADLGVHWSKQWWLDLGFGLILGALLMGLIFWVEWLNGWVKITDFFQQTQIILPFSLTILAPLLVFVVVGITEELLARGYQLRNLAEGFYFPWLGTQGAVIAAWLVSSVLFGLLHVNNPHSSWGSTAALMIVGLFFGLGYVLTGNLAISIGLHITWNFFQGSILGFPVSGRDFGNITMIALQQGGPDLWTGGAFGPEAGLIGLVAIVLGCGAILLWVRWQYGKVKLCTALVNYQP